MQWLVDVIQNLLNKYLPSPLVPNRKVVAAGVAAPAVPIFISLLKLVFPVMPRWLDFLLSLVGGAAPVAAAYSTTTKALGTQPGTTKVI